MSNALIALGKLWLADESGGASYKGEGMTTEAASTLAGGYDTLYQFIALLSAFFFVLIVAFMVYFVWKYKERSPDQKTHPLEGNFRLEVAWSVIPGLLLVLIFAWGTIDYFKMIVPPGNAYEIRVNASKWNWSFEYPNGVISSDLMVPENRPIKLVMESSDVLHSMFIPAFRVKKDVIPSRYTVLWFEATKLGTYQFQCAEYCGTEHSFMGTKLDKKSGNYVNFVKVVPQEEFDAWLASGGPLGVPEQVGSEGEALSATDFQANADFSTIALEERLDASGKGTGVMQPATPRPLEIEGSAAGNDGLWQIDVVKDASKGLVTLSYSPNEEKGEDRSLKKQLVPEKGVSWKLDQDPVKKGELMFSKLMGCASCHSVTGEKKTGPPLNGLFSNGGETFVDGSSISWKEGVTADGVDPFRTYIKESLLSPNAKVVKDFSPQMPSFKGRLSSREINYIIEYIKSVD